MGKSQINIDNPCINTPLCVRGQGSLHGLLPTGVRGQGPEVRGHYDVGNSVYRVYWYVTDSRGCGGICYHGVAMVSTLEVLCSN